MDKNIIRKKLIGDGAKHPPIFKNLNSLIKKC